MVVAESYPQHVFWALSHLVRFWILTRMLTLSFLTISWLLLQNSGMNGSKAICTLSQKSKFHHHHTKINELFAFTITNTWTTRPPGSTRPSHFSRLLAITVPTEMLTGRTAGLWRRRGREHTQIRWNVVIILCAVLKIFWTRCHMCLHVCLVWPPKLKAASGYSEPIKGFDPLPKIGLYFHLLKEVFVLRRTDKMSVICFLCLTYEAFQDHSKTHSLFLPSVIDSTASIRQITIICSWRRASQGVSDSCWIIYRVCQLIISHYTLCVSLLMFWWCQRITSWLLKICLAHITKRPITL